jgi:hypothetical protein
LGSESPPRVLVVANITATAPSLIEAVHERAARGPARFHLLVPNPAPADLHLLHPERKDRVSAAERALIRALPILDAAVGSPVTGSLSIRHDPMDAIEDALWSGHFDEIILSTLPHRLSRWLHIDLPGRVRHLGLPVTTVTAEDSPAVPTQR